MKHLYLLINIAAVSLPLVFSFHRKIRFASEWRSVLKSILIPMILFLPWDMMFTAQQVWGFNGDYLTGASLFNLPLEEVLFFICIPYACLFTYHCLSLLKTRIVLPSNNSVIHIIIASGFIVLSVVFFHLSYTSVTLFLLGLVLFVAILFFPGNLIHFYRAYLILLVPFFIVNGILTGTGIPGEIVWYNNDENLGIRILTIPVEDIFYGMLLILMNVFLYEWYRKKESVRVNLQGRGNYGLGQQIASNR